MTVKATERRLERAEKRLLRIKFFSLLFLILFIVALVAIFFNNALGWFSSDTPLVAGQQSVTVQNEPFELALSGDQVSPYAADAPIVTYLSAVEGIEKANATDGENGPVSILCNFMIENPYEVGSSEIAPGSYGKISFDIVVPASYTGSFDITLDTLAYGISGTTPQALAAADEAILYPLIEGHVLLFEGRATRATGGYYYTDRIIDDRLTYDLSDPDNTTFVSSDGKHYTVTIYWVWPATFAQIALTEDNPKLHMNSVFHSESDRLEILDYIVDNQSMFFRNLIPIVDFTATGFEDTYFVELSDAYNYADQFIGDKAHFLVLRATVTPQ